MCNLHGALWCRLRTITLNTFESQVLKLSIRAVCIRPQMTLLIIELWPSAGAQEDKERLHTHHFALDILTSHFICFTSSPVTYFVVRVHKTWMSVRLHHVGHCPLGRSRFGLRSDASPLSRQTRPLVRCPHRSLATRTYIPRQ